jgi:hypothetical protein
MTTNMHTAFQVILSILIALALWLLPAGAGSQTRWDYCKPIPHGTVCVNRAAKVTQITCDWGYQPRFGRIPRCVSLN